VADPRGLDHIFTFFAMGTRRTMFEGVQSVLPGHYLKIAFRRVPRPHARAGIRKRENRNSPPLHASLALFTKRLALLAFRAEAVRTDLRALPLARFLCIGDGQAMNWPKLHAILWRQRRGT
jgi:hypothetical protein